MRTTYDWVGSRLEVVLNLRINWSDGLAQLSPTCIPHPYTGT